MNEWPISTREACRRLGLPYSTGVTLIRACHVPTNPIGTANTLDESAFRMFEEVSAPFRPASRPRQGEPEVVAAS